ncbi:MAG: ABC transporter substrate-binding protein [Bacilli bacterium]|nr:ABC transporter substrate-binding protein [Bacilli bacterium]
MKKFLRLMSLVLVVSMFLGLAACGDGGSDTIKLGSTGPLSGSASIYGQAVKKGVELAIEEINKAGGVDVNGVKKQLELVDFINDEADADKAGAGLATLMEAGVDVVVGAVTSGATEGLIAEAIKTGVPVITPTGTADKLTVGANGDEREARENIFRACFYDSYQGEYMAKYAAEKGIKKAYVLYNTDEDYSVGLKDAFVKTAAANGVTVETQGYDKTVKDFASYWAPIVAGGYDCVYLPDYYENVYNILKTGYAAGYNGVCYGGDGWDGVVQQIKEGDNVEFLEKCFYTNHYFGGSETTAVKKFVDAYKAKYNGEVPVSFAALAYDAVYIAKQAIEKAGSVDFDAVVEAFATGTFTGLVTSASEFSFDANGNPQKDAVVITFKDAKEVEAK